MKKWTLIILLSLVALTLLAITGIFNKPDFTGNEASEINSKKNSLSNIAAEFEDSMREAVQSQEGPLQQFEKDLVTKLRLNYLEHINNLAVQASLFKIKKQLISMDPKNGASVFELAIRKAFPEQAESILKIMEGMMVYHEWLSENLRRLDDMSPLTRNGTLWEQRHKIFGEDADIIWAHEREALMQKQVKIQDTIHRLDTANDIDLNEKLYQLRTSIDEAYSGTIEGLSSNASVISQVFFGLESVQSELKSLSDTERQNTINDVRQQLGYSEEQIAIQQKFDEDHNARWKIGNAYMAERNELTDGLDKQMLLEPQTQTRLKELRRKHFKHEAETIEKEEKSGFYRFNRPRVYGRN